MVEKINPFAQILEMYRAFTDTDKFYRLRKQSIGSRLLYALVICIISSIIFCGIHTVKVKADLKELLHMLPDFSYMDGSMWCEEQYEELSDGVYIVVDTDQRAFTKEYAYGLLEHPEVDEVLLLSKTNMVVYNEEDAECEEMTYADFFGLIGVDLFSKQQLLYEYSGFVTKIAIIVTLVMILYNLIKIFGFALFFAVLALIVNAVNKSNESFVTLYWISFYIESFFLMALSIVKPLLGDYAAGLGMACIAMFAFTMDRVLKKGEPVAENAITTVYNTDDELDVFLLQTEEEMMYGTQESQSVYDEGVNGAIGYQNLYGRDMNSDMGYQSSIERYGKERKQEETKSFSGLLLKREE